MIGGIRRCYLSASGPKALPLMRTARFHPCERESIAPWFPERFIDGSLKGHGLQDGSSLRLTALGKHHGRIVFTHGRLEPSRVFLVRRAIQDVIEIFLRRNSVTMAFYSRM
jgi:hypothetical protein